MLPEVLDAPMHIWRAGSGKRGKERKPPKGLSRRREPIQGQRVGASMVWSRRLESNQRPAVYESNQDKF